MSEGRFPIPERVQGGGEVSVIGYLDGLASALVERLSRHFGPEFEVRREPAEHPFILTGASGSPYRLGWHIGVHRGPRLEAAVTIDWSEGISAGHFDLQWQEIKPFDGGAATAAACFALAGLALGWSVSWGVALAGMLLVAPFGTLAWVGWRRPSEVRKLAAAPALDALVSGAGPVQVGI